MDVEGETDMIRWIAQLPADHMLWQDFSRQKMACDH